MKTIEIKGHLRESIGSKTAKELRREGQVPCVLYGGESNTHFYADIRELNKLIFTQDVYQVNLDLDGKTASGVMREPQYHPVNDELIHLDFVEIVPGKVISMRIPLHLEGNSIGVKNGGVLRHNAKKLLVRGLIENIPAEIMVDITNMKIGSSKKVGELNIPNLEILESSNRVVVAIKTSRKAIVDEAAEEEGEEGTEEGAEGAAESTEAAAE